MPVKVSSHEQMVGDYSADIIVEDQVIIELKAAEALCEEHEYQLLNYLKATNIEVGLLLNLAKIRSFSRNIFTNKETPK